MKNASRLARYWLAYCFAVLVVGLSTSVAYAIEFSENKLTGSSYETYGVSIGDVNDDHCPDVFYSNHRFQPTVYINNCDGTFTNQPQLLLDANISADTHGGAFADFDNDGDSDLYTTSGGESPANPNHENEFYINENGTLTNQASAYGLLFPENRGRQPLWMDANRDGLLDLGVFGQAANQASNYGVSSIFIQDANTTSSFTQSNDALGFDCDNFAYTPLLADLGGNKSSANTPILDLVCGEYNFPEAIYDMSSGFPTQFENITSVFKGRIKPTNDVAVGDFNNDGFNDLFIVKKVELPNHGVILADSNTKKFAVNLKNDIKTSVANIAATGVRIYTTGALTMSVEAPNLAQGLPMLDPPYNVSKREAIWIGASNNGEGVNPDKNSFVRRVPDKTSFEIPSNFAQANTTLNPNDVINQGIRQFDISYPSYPPTSGEGQVPDAFHIGYINDDPNPANHHWKILVYNDGFTHTVITGDSTQGISRLEIIQIDKITGQESIHAGRDAQAQAPVLFTYNASEEKLIENNDILVNGDVVKIHSSSVVAGDFDNDMDLDLIAACEFAPETCDHYLYTNNGQGQFALSRLSNLAELITDSVATADFNNDGFLDIALSNGWFTSTFDGLLNEVETHAVHLNTLKTNNAIEFDLEGVASNKDGIGATVKVSTPDSKVQFREQNNGVHKYSQNHQRLHFGVGTNSIANVEVNWDNGQVDSYSSVPVNALYKAVEGAQELQNLASFDKQAPITIAVNDVIVDEGAGFAEFEVTLSRAPGRDLVEFQFTTLDETATNGEDYITTSDLITLTGPAISTRISVAIVDDFDIEGPETFSFEISNVIGAVIARSTGLATINENDQNAPENLLSISEVVVDERQEEAIIKFTLSEPPGQFPVEFNFSTVSDSALEGEDFEAKSGLRDFSGNETEKFVTIPIINDDTIEPNEIFHVEIYDLFGASLVNSSAAVTIRDDDTPTTNILTVDQVTVDEAVGVAVIKFSLSQAPDQNYVEFNFSTLNGTAIDGIDFSGESGFRTMTGLETDKFVSIPIFDDDVSEGVETFDVEISNLIGAEIENSVVTSSIIDNDQITNTLTIADVSVNESSTAIVFKFALDQAPGENLVEFNFSTADGTALDGQDYTGKSGYRSMQGPTKETYLSIPIINDSDSETPETFSLTISNVHGAMFNGVSATATIEDDDL